jgi:glc operon protein GlcG
MFSRTCIGVDDTQRAIAAMLADARKQPERPVAVAIVDERGDLLAYAKMDGVPPWPARMARRKAYTAALMRSDTAKYVETLRQRGTNVADAGDPELAATQGGVVVVVDGAVIGGVGVSGNTAERDEELAHIGLDALFGKQAQKETTT